jgi:tetratricopeptide (TPR) repeat protein
MSSFNKYISNWAKYFGFARDAYYKEEYIEALRNFGQALTHMVKYECDANEFKIKSAAIVWSTAGFANTLIMLDRKEDAVIHIRQVIRNLPESHFRLPLVLGRGSSLAWAINVLLNCEDEEIRGLEKYVEQIKDDLRYGFRKNDEIYWDAMFKISNDTVYALLNGALEDEAKDFMQWLTLMVGEDPEGLILAEKLRDKYNYSPDIKPLPPRSPITVNTVDIDHLYLAAQASLNSLKKAVKSGVLRRVVETDDD